MEDYEYIEKLIERLDDGETSMDAVDEAIEMLRNLYAENEQLRKALEKLEVHHGSIGVYCPACGYGEGHDDDCYLWNTLKGGK